MLRPTKRCTWISQTLRVFETSELTVGQHNKTMTEDDYISVIDVAKEVGKAKQTVFKVLKRLSIESQKMRGPDSRGQLIAYITQEESSLVKAEIQNMRGSEQQ